MPKITEPVPLEVAEELSELRERLDRDIPAKVLDYNLLIATWNIRAFGDLTEKWKSEAKDSPKRDLHSLCCIAEIVSRFDVIALQEVRANIKSLRHMLKLLGTNWGLILTDVTKGDKGNGERMAFLYDTRKVHLSGLACELVVPKEQFNKISPDALERQFARTPYAVSFRSAGKTFILVTLHIIYGKKAKERTAELKAIAGWLAKWTKNINAWDQNLIALGDFNIDRKGDELYDAFTSTGLFIPEDLHNVPRSIFTKKSDLNKFYDQIAWFTGKNNATVLPMKYLQGGSFDFTKAVLKSRNLTKSELSWHLSDHYPLWVEFQVRE